MAVDAEHRALVKPHIAIVGAGPAGLMAAEVARSAGAEVDVYEQMPSVARKFLIAGKGGLNLTHSEDFERFVGRYRERAPQVRRWLERFDAQGLRQWARELGFETIIGSSGRVFPADLKAGPMLRTWVRRLRGSGVRIHVGHRWLGWDSAGALRFEHAGETLSHDFDAVILALGGGSWAKLGSDGSWVSTLAQRSIDVATLRPSNCGFECAWTPHFRDRFAGVPVKPVEVSLVDRLGHHEHLKGELMITGAGVEGSAIYALSAQIRDLIEAHGHARIELDLLPDLDLARVTRELGRARGTRSFSEHLRRTLGILGVKAGLLFETLPDATQRPTDQVAAHCKALPITLLRTRPLDEAISSAGGVRLEAFDDDLQLRALPGVWCAGEMLDWEAPTGGYLLTACFASAVVAARGAVKGKNLLTQNAQREANTKCH